MLLHSHMYEVSLPVRGGSATCSCRCHHPSLYCNPCSRDTLSHSVHLQARPSSSWKRTRDLHVVHGAVHAKGLVSDKEAYRIFDEVCVVVRSGDGGNGEIVEANRGKIVKNLKYHAGANQPKKIWLPASAPAEGADGGDVVLVCDPSCGDLLHLHQRKVYTAQKGSNGNPAVGSGGPKANEDMRKAKTPALEIPVPPGTVVKKKGSGAFLGELLNPGDRLLVARGGRGGKGVRAPSREQKVGEQQRAWRKAQKTGAEIIEVEDINWRQDSLGLPGQQLGLDLILRVVADVAIVGFPNAGKSSLLAAMTRASPEVAPYPFTTLMPNLGVLSMGGTQKDELVSGTPKPPVLADLPGLIEGAHKGKGLGRMFLRHLRRTNVLLHVVDASVADPATDYLAVREELRMYNPTYVSRPHVVALNKMDLEDAGGLKEEVATEVALVARQFLEDHPDLSPSLPWALVPCSAITGEGVADLAEALSCALADKPWHKWSGQSLARLPGQGAGGRPEIAGNGLLLSGMLIGSSDLVEASGHQDHMAEGHASGDRHYLASDDTGDEDDPGGEAGADLSDPDAYLFDLSEEQLLELVD